MPRYDYYYPIFMEALGRQDLIGDERYFPQTAVQAHLAEFSQIIAEEVGKRTLDEMIELMNKADLPYAVCQTWDQLLVDEQAWGSDALTKVSFPATVKVAYNGAYPCSVCRY